VLGRLVHGVVIDEQAGGGAGAGHDVDEVLPDVRDGGRFPGEEPGGLGNGGFGVVRTVVCDQDHSVLLVSGGSIDHRHGATPLVAGAVSQRTDAPRRAAVPGSTR
jgi:hypothetical protein